jgi:Icc-related predicted phosphoesterase
MAIVQLMSDLHLEFHRDGGNAFIKALDPSGVDVLVLAGDIDTERGGLHGALQMFCSKWPQVVFLTGNHEYYNSSPKKVANLVGHLTRKLPNLTWLNCGVAEVSGIRFVGGTLWFPGAPSNEVWNQRLLMNDYHIIKDFEPWVYEENARCRAVLQAEARTADVVMTHHIPTRHGIAPQYAGSPLNHYFCHDLTDLIEETKPPVWLFGHSHSSHDFKVGQTRLVANPLGYPSEQGVPGLRFNPRLLLEVPTTPSPTASGGKRSEFDRVDRSRSGPTPTPPRSTDES